MRHLLSWQTAQALGGVLLALGALLAYAGQSTSQARRRRLWPRPRAGCKVLRGSRARPPEL